MATVDFGTVWVQSAADLSDGVELGLRAWSSPTAAVVEVRRRAGGRLVSVSTPGVSRKVMATVAITDRDDLSWLEGMCGALVLVRGARGQRVWGVFDLVEGPEQTWPEFPIDVQFTLSEVTVSEVV